MIGWLKLFEHLPTIITTLGGLLGSAKTVTGDKSEVEKANAAENVASKEAYAAEFSYKAAQRTAFDSLMDGVNRTPRPLLALGTIALFVWAAVDPSGFSVTMTAVALIPEHLWSLLLLIISFYFGSRALEKMVWPSTFKVPAAAEALARAEIERRARMRDEAERAKVVVPTPIALPAPPEPSPAPVAKPAAAVEPMPAPTPAPAPQRPSVMRFDGSVEELLQLAGFGLGKLHRNGFTGSLPKARGKGWSNPVSSAWAGKVPIGA